MKPLTKYHLITQSPTYFLLVLFCFQIIGSAVFTVCILIDLFMFRPIMDYKRLKQKGLVTRKEYLRSLGFVRLKHLEYLMFTN